MICELKEKGGDPMRKDLYQVLLGVYLCQCWKVEFKGITEPVLFMILFSDFVTPQKCTMSEGCWLSTLNIKVQSLGNRDLIFRWFQPNLNTCKKLKSSKSRPRGQKLKKETLFSATSKVWENINYNNLHLWMYLFFLFELFCIFDLSMCR